MHFIDILGHWISRIDRIRRRMYASIVWSHWLIIIVCCNHREDQCTPIMWVKRNGGIEIAAISTFGFFHLQAQTNQEHSHSTQASPTNTLKHVKRQRARSADESNKNLLSPREQKPTAEHWASTWPLRVLTRIFHVLVSFLARLEHSSWGNSYGTEDWKGFFWNGV